MHGDVLQRLAVGVDHVAAVFGGFEGHAAVAAAERLLPDDRTQHPVREPGRIAPVVADGEAERGRLRRAVGGSDRHAVSAALRQNPELTRGARRQFRIRFEARSQAERFRLGRRERPDAFAFAGRNGQCALPYAGFSREQLQSAGNGGRERVVQLHRAGDCSAGPEKRPFRPDFRLQPAGENDVQLRELHMKEAVRTAQREPVLGEPLGTGIQLDRKHLRRVVFTAHEPRLRGQFHGFPVPHPFERDAGNHPPPVDRARFERDLRQRLSARNPDRQHYCGRSAFSAFPDGRQLRNRPRIRRRKCRHADVFIPAAEQRRGGQRRQDKPVFQSVHRSVLSFQSPR